MAETGNTGCEVIYVPSKQKPIIFLRDKIAQMMQETSKVSKPVFGAAALLLIAAVLTLAVVIGLNQGQPYMAKPNNLPPVKAPEVKAMEVQAQPQVQTPEQPSIQPSSQAILVPPKAVVQPRAEADVKPEASPLGSPQRPLRGDVLVAYGWQEHPVFKDWRFHNGIDIAAGEGEEVAAMWPGEVKEILQDKTSGLTVLVASGEYTVHYGSLATAAVRKGAKIKAGAKIGAVGTSQAEPYPHLHLSVKKGESYIDPAEKF